MPRYTSDEIKAMVLHFGSFEKAAQVLQIPKSVLVNAAYSDIKQTRYRITEEFTESINRKLKRLAPSTRDSIRDWEDMLDTLHRNPNVKNMLLHADSHDLAYARSVFDKYSDRLRQDILWSKIAAKMYDKHGWKRGKFS